MKSFTKSVFINLLVMAIGLAEVSGVRGSTPELRIGVRETGIYFVSATEIGLELGMSYSEAKSLILASDVSLVNNGITVACYVDPAGEGIYFYGEAIDSVYTDENAYRLVWNNADYMNTLGVSASAAVTNQAFMVTRHYEEDNIPAYGYVTDPASDIYYWNKMNATVPAEQARDFPFYAEKVSGLSSNAEISLDMYSWNSAGISNEHHIVVKLNGTNIGETTWMGIKAYSPSFSFPQSILLEGSNTLNVTAVSNGVSASGLHLRSFDLTYARTYDVIKEGQLVFKAVPSMPVTVTGLTTNKVKVVELGYKDDPRLLTNYSVVETGGAYKVYFDAPADIQDYAVFTEGAGLAASSISVISEDSLKLENGAEYIIVTHRDLAASAQALADYRSSRFLSSRVVFVEDIYNEFNDGVADPAAIKEFLSYACTNWFRKPKYVLLAGAGSYDYRNVEGTGECLVPPVLQFLEQGLPSERALCSTDPWYVDLDNDGVSEIPVGRIPALTDEELLNYVAKVSEYESAQNEAWHSRIVLAADNPDHGGDFHASSDIVEAQLPVDYSSEKIYVGNLTPAESHSNIVAAINAGTLLLNYYGHGGSGVIAWDNSFSLLSNSDVLSLGNSGRPVVMTAMSCVINAFEFAGYASLGESLVMATNGGAVAVWAPSWMAYNELSEMLGVEFYKTVLQGEVKIIGDAIVAAQAAFRDRKTDARVLQMYNLLGEPVAIIPGVGMAEDDPYALPIPELDEWKNTNFTVAVTNVNIVGDYADPDGDDLPNLIEYAFGRNPKAKDTESLFSLRDKGELEVSVPYDVVLNFNRRKGLSGVNINVMLSADLINWDDAGGRIQHSRVVDDGNGETETVQLYIDSPDYSDAWFFRMKVSRDH